MAHDPSKTEQATPKRVSKARGKGNVAKSQEVPKAMSVLAGLVILTFWTGFIGKDLMGIFRFFLSSAPTYTVNDAALSSLFFWLSAELAKMILPVIVFIAAAIYLTMRLQVGRLWTMEPLKPKLSKFNPLNGLKRMLFSAQTFIRLGKSLLHALCIGFAPYLVIKEEMPKLVNLYYLDAMQLSIYILTVGSRIVFYALLPMLALAAMDLWYTRWEYKRNLMMSKDEVKDERRQAEGDPKIKNKQRQDMMRMSMRRMMQEVPKADVVITNPTHIAVALRYDPDEAPAPVVVAMGADLIALKIKDLAREHGIPLRENVPLARALYKQTQIGDTIPAELFQAVAAILAQIWKTKPPKRRKT
ncbi:MAG: flagellar biosynthesis protein FlhB [Deltaproteobacteria bacterium]|jgi:flagellar biosynthetic protein FlhB|nr:flagellar biosynthesis protein FlhB [Deltaproteobacteria bacterium]